MSAYKQFLTGLLLCGVSLAGGSIAFGHAEHDRARYVANHGADQGRCADPVEPCASIAYAASQAGKGDSIRVATGRFEIQSARDVFYLLSDVIPVTGGYTSADGFSKQHAASQPTTIIGVPAQFRDALTERGFHLIADTKSLSPQIHKGMVKLSAQYANMQRSHTSVGCAGGVAGGFACASVDLLAHVALADMSLAPSSANDVWGFVDLNDMREYAIVGVRNGVVVFDVSEPGQPREVGAIAAESTTWRDIKIYQYFDSSARRWQAFAYVTADNASQGLLVLDLAGLPNVVTLISRNPTDRSAHNIYISNVDYSTGTALTGMTPFINIAGSNLSRGSLRIYHLIDPRTPTFLTAPVTQQLDYAHDLSSLVIDDARATTQCASASGHCEVVLDFNEREIQLWDATSKSALTRLSRTSYPDASYVHSGWWAEGKQYIFVHDELDEQNHALNTTLRVFDITDLGQPLLVGVWTGPTRAIDHNGFVRGNRYYMSNYERGLTVLDISEPTAPREVGFFDTYPVGDSASFNGAWGVYPFLPSGTLLVSDINSGLYVLGDNSLASNNGQLALAASALWTDEGQPLRVTVARDGDAQGAVSVGFETMSGSAGDADFVATRVRLDWPDGDNSPRVVDIDVPADGVGDAGEQFFVRLFDPRGGATLLAPSIAVVTIDEPLAQAEIGFADSGVRVSEGAGQVIIGVERRVHTQGVVSVAYETRAGSATPGSDFTALSKGTLQWAAGEGGSKSIVVPIREDSDVEGDESFSLDITAVTGNTTLTGNSGFIVSISDNDEAPVPAGITPVANTSGGGGGTLSLPVLAGLLLLACANYRRRMASARRWTRGRHGPPSVRWRNPADSY